MSVLRLLSRAKTVALGAALWAAPGVALAQEPHNWQLGFQPAQSPVQAQIEWLHGLVLILITAIVVFVAVMLLYTSWRFGRARHPKANKVSHNTALEIAWTIVPALILVVIAIPSFRLVYYEDRTREADLTIKATGHQWYWEYTYPDQGGVDFTSYPVDKDNPPAGTKRLLDVDNQLVLPVGKNVRILTTSGDVIHSFFIPSLGVQRYAIPGRTIETWVRVDRPGTYYGECNQICGTNHSNMPISVKGVTPEEFTAWTASAKAKFAADAPATPIHLASQP